MTSHQIIYDITYTVFMTSLPLYLKWHLPYLCHHSDYCWSQTNFMFDITSTLRMPSYALYTTSKPLLWLHTIVLITLHPLHPWHHTPYIWHHRHGNTNVISAIWPTISNTTSTVSVSSNPGYQLYHTHSLYDITHTIRVTSYSVCMLSLQLFMTSYPSVYNITPSIFMTSYPIRMLPPYCFHENITTIPDISPTIFDITATVSVITQMAHTPVSMYRPIDDITKSV